jgi:hypothetical protein
MGAVLTAELIAEAGNLSRFRSADALASAGGIAPVLRQSGKTRFLRRPIGGNKGLKRVFYQSAFCSLGHDHSRAFYTASGARENATIRPSSPWPAGASMSSGPSSNPAPPSRPGSKQPLDRRIRLPPPHHRVAERYWRSYGARFESRALASCRGHANCAVAAMIVR